MVDVEQRTLRTFKQHALAGLAQFMADAGHVRLHRIDIFTKRHGFIEGLLEVHRLHAQVLGQHEVVVIQRRTQLFGQRVGIVQIGNADTATRHLVFIRRANPAPGGANRLATGSLFAGLIQCDVVRHDQRRGGRNLQPWAHFHASGFQFLDFLAQCGRRDHHPVADQAQRVVAQDAGRDQVQHRLLAVDDQRVAGVVAALKAHHRADILGEQVHNLALALIAPLRAQHHH